jgi:signal transduction histidine kinase
MRKAQPRSRLPELIWARRDDVVERWKRRVREDLGERIDGLALEDSLPDFLVALCEALRRGVHHRAPRAPAAPAAASAQHGEQRASLPIDLTQLIWEYGVLRDVVLDLADEEALAISIAEMRIFTDAIVAGIAESSRSFVEARRAAEAKAQRAEEQLHEAQAFEQRLIAIVSHDLRNPLNAILLGARALLARGELTERDAAAVARMRSAGERATRLIRDLLDLTRARLGGGIPVEPRPTDLTAVARGVVDELKPSFPDREIRLEAPEPCPGLWDPDRLAQAIGNLVTNALKYGDPAAPVQIRTTCEREARIEVHNEGEPIPEAIRPGLFDPWERGARGVDPSGRSAGLGLYIVERIATAHGGRVELDSAAGRGTTFTVVLPLEAPAS